MFNSRNLHNDIAILTTAQQVPLGQLPSIAPACLADPPITQNLTCFISGWGRNDYDVILKISKLDILDIFSNFIFFSTVWNKPSNSEKCGCTDC